MNEYSLLYHAIHYDGMVEIWVALPKGSIYPITITKEYDDSDKEYLYTCENLCKRTKEPIEDPILDILWDVNSTWENWA